MDFPIALAFSAIYLKVGKSFDYAPSSFDFPCLTRPQVFLFSIIQQDNEVIDLFFILQSLETRGSLSKKLLPAKVREMKGFYKIKHRLAERAVSVGLK